MSLARVFVQVLALSFSRSAADQPLTDASAAAATATQDLIQEAAAPPPLSPAADNQLSEEKKALENLAVDIGASANTHRVTAFPHDDFSSQSLDAGLQADPATDPIRASIIRRESMPLGDATFDSARRTIEADEIKRDRLRDLMSRDSENEESMPEAHHKPAYQEDPRFTPEAIFANKHIAPEIAEFLGHLAQKSRVHRKEYKHQAREAGLISQGKARVTSPGGDNEDDSDDIEDMKRAAASAPKATALAHFFERLDSKTTAASWIASECAALSKNITDKYAQMAGRSRATWATTGPAGAAGRSEIHTGMFFKHWNIAKNDMSTATRKLRLGVLSFLATQDAAKVKLHIWTDDAKSTREMLGPIAHHPEFMDAINITTFDPKVEFEKVPPTYARETLIERYKKGTMPNLRSDLYRSVILYNYGGLWMDADTVLMQDVAPLLGEDWAHLVKGKEGAIEGALLSASHPKSHFMNEYLINMVMREAPMDDEEQQKPLLVEIFNSDPAHTTMHVLPPCFMDSDPAVSTETAVLSSDASPGSIFFGKAVAEPYREFFSIGIQDAVQDNSTGDVSVLQDASLAQPASDDEDEEDKPAPTTPSWAYHWRGNFAAPWSRGSLADVAERTFMKKLQLKKFH